MFSRSPIADRLAPQLLVDLTDRDDASGRIAEVQPSFGAFRVMGVKIEDVGHDLQGIRHLEVHVADQQILLRRVTMGLRDLATQFQFVGHDSGQAGQCGFISFRECDVRSRRDDADRAQTVAFRVPDRGAGVEADARLADDQRIVAKPRVAPGIADDQRGVLLDRMIAERP